MKCKDCNSTLCSYRTSDAEKDCFYESHQDYPMPRDLWNNDNTDWRALRNQAAIAAMQGFLSRQTYRNGLTTLVNDSVRLANYLIEELKKRN